jgi:hypothetical protein
MLFAQERDVVLHMRFGQGERVRGNAENTVISGQNERDGRQQGPPSKVSV